MVPKALGALGYLEVDPLQLDKVIGFLKAVVVFFATLFTSMMALRDLNVDTVIVFRSSLPLAVALGDFLFMQRELPGARTWAALTLTLGGAAAFARAESQLRVANCMFQLDAKRACAFTAAIQHKPRGNSQWYARLNELRSFSNTAIPAGRPECRERLP